MKTFNYSMDNILYQIFKISLSKSSQKGETVTFNPPIRIYVNKMEKKVNIKTRHYLVLLMAEMVKLLESTNIRQLKMKMLEMYLIEELLK